MDCDALRDDQWERLREFLPRKGREGQAHEGDERDGGAKYGQQRRDFERGENGCLTALSEVRRQGQRSKCGGLRRGRAPALSLAGHRRG